jgi:P-loop containing NTP hydrolase pore-1
MNLANCISHPDPLVESSSLAAVEFPKIKYEVILPKVTYRRGLLSSPQMESVM